MRTGLVCLGRDFRGGLVAALRSAPPEVQALWVEVVKFRSVTPRVKEARGCCGSRCEMVLLLDGTSGNCATCGAESHDIGRVVHSDVVTRTRDLQVQGLPKGSDCKRALLQMFDPLLHVAREVQIVDRYGIVDAKRRESRQPGTSGLVRLVRRATSLAVPKLNVYVSESQGQDEPKIRSDFLQLLRAARPFSTEIWLHVVPEDVGRKDMHDRWVGGHWGAGCISVNVGKGLCQFDGGDAVQDFNVSIQDSKRVQGIVARVAPRARSSRCR